MMTESKEREAGAGRVVLYGAAVGGTAGERWTVYKTAGHAEGTEESSLSET